MVIGASETPGSSTHLHADGRYGELLAAATPSWHAGAELEAYMYMKGNDVFKVAVTA